MKRILLLSLIALSLLLFTGCPYGYKYDQGKFPGTPQNLWFANSEYDDYNMTAPTIENWRFLYFSSNRNSQGNDFDVVGSNLYMVWDKDKGTLNVANIADSWKNYDYVDSLFYMMNTGSNEYGPNSMVWTGYEGVNSYYTDMIAYANDATGNLDLKMVYFKCEGEYATSSAGTYYGPVTLNGLNSPSNDAYLTFYGPSFMLDGWNTHPDSITEAYFCSDRGGNFDIYRADVPADSSLTGFLISDNNVQVTPVDVLNSSGEDKCPFIDGKLLVFTSDRPGGYGGFDLYYCRRNGDTWSEPKNFGEKINTKYNEYRPIVMKVYEFQNDLMLFSSDRPNGKGGYDLYYVGIPAMIE